MYVKAQDRLREEFSGILADKQLGVVYQPIVSLATGWTRGWEALARGPESGYFSRADRIFDFAEENGLLFLTEKLCWEKAIGCVGDLDAGQALFVNVHPQTVSNPAFAEGEILRTLERCCRPENVVIEVTEKHGIRDFKAFRRVLDGCRRRGLRIAIDDVGSGFSGLQSIAEIRPEFLKIDMSLVRGIDRDTGKQHVIESLVGLAENLGCKTIAEGIETQEELDALSFHGVHYGQGYYLARPEFPKKQEKIRGGWQGDG